MMVEKMFYCSMNLHAAVDEFSFNLLGLPQESSGQNTVVVLGSAVGVTVGVLILTVLAAVFFLKRKKVEIIRKSTLFENASTYEVTFTSCTI